MKTSRLVSLCVCVAACSIVGAASAQERREGESVAGAASGLGNGEPAPGAAPAEPPPRRARGERTGDEGGARTHDGFYLRMGLGYGYMTTSVDPGASTVKGNGSAWLLSIGGSPMPGLVIAGTMFMHFQSSPTFESGGQSVTADKTLFALDIGPTVDYYIDPHGGLHVGGSLFYSTFNGVNYTSTGYGVALHGGYDFWVSDSWSIGPALQLAYSKTAKDPEKDGTTSIALMVEFVDH